MAGGRGHEGTGSDAESGEAVMSVAHRIRFSAGAFALLLATMLGAYGAHGLAGLPENVVRAYQTAVQYQFFHGLGLLLTTLIAQRFPQSKLIDASGWLLLIGILFFSGSIYATTFGAPDAVGGLAPIGGVSLMLGWLALGLGTIRAK